MPNLDIYFNCLCLFAVDADQSVVHVLMPTMPADHGADHDGADVHAAHEHVVRLVHPSFDEPYRQIGKAMEGWALVFGPDKGSALAAFAPPADPSQPVLPNLTALANGAKLDRVFVGPSPGEQVAARVTLRAGSVLGMSAEATWNIGSMKNVTLAHQVVWRMALVDAAMRWEPLNGRAAADPKPLDRLKDLEPADDNSYMLEIYHVTPKALPPHGAILKPSEVREHFRALESLLPALAEMKNPPLPEIVSKHVDHVNCVGGRVEVNSVE